MLETGQSGAARRRSGFEFVHGDICDAVLLKELFDRHQFATVVHFARKRMLTVQSSTRTILSAPMFRNPYAAGSALAAWKSAPDGRRFHHISTDEVYGSLGPNDPPFTEVSRYDPKSHIPRSKAASDFLVRLRTHLWPSGVDHEFVE